MRMCQMAHPLFLVSIIYEVKVISFTVIVLRFALKYGKYLGSFLTFLQFCHVFRKKICNFVSNLRNREKKEVKGEVNEQSTRMLKRNNSYTKCITPCATHMTPC